MNEKTMNFDNLKSVSTLIIMGMCTAIIAVLSQISIPLPSGVPVTLQTFAIALTGYLLGWKGGTISTLVYVLLGTIGVPVFANFTGGVSCLFGKTGGFIFGFIFMAFLCGLGMNFKKRLRVIILITFSCLGLGICHLIGIIQFSVLTHISLGKSALLVSVPYIIKDIISVICAYFLSSTIRKAIIR